MHPHHHLSKIVVLCLQGDEFGTHYPGPLELFLHLPHKPLVLKLTLQHLKQKHKEEEGEGERERGKGEGEGGNGGEEGGMKEKINLLQLFSHLP